MPIPRMIAPTQTSVTVRVERPSTGANASKGSTTAGWTHARAGSIRWNIGGGPSCASAHATSGAGLGFLVRQDTPRHRKRFPEPDASRQVAHRLLARDDVVGPARRALERQERREPLFSKSRFGRVDELHQGCAPEDVEIAREGVLPIPEALAPGRQRDPRRQSVERSRAH